MTDVNALVLHRLTIRRTPGIPDPYTIDGLCGGVNVIHGPNGSGKSSTARAIQAALWPGAEPHRALGITAAYTFGASTFVVELDAGHVVVQQDGRDARVPELPAPELRERYALSLHDLVRAANDGDRFAAHIAVESAGGFDLEAAARAVGCREKPSNAGAESRAHREAKRRLREAQDRQAALHADGRRVAELEAETAGAAPAAARARVIAKAMTTVRAATHRDEVHNRLAAFPSAMALVRGDELTRLTDIAERAAIIREQEHAAREAFERAGTDAREALPSRSPPPELLVALREHAAALPALEQTRAEATRRALETAAKLGEAREAIGTAATDDQLAAVGDASFGDVVELAREADALFGEQSAVDALLSDVGPPDAQPEVGAVHRAVASLQGWLREDSRRSASRASTADRPRQIWFAILAAVAIAGWVLLAIVWRPAALVGVAVAALLTVVALRRSAPDADGCAAQERAYPAPAISLPDAWTREVVARRLDELYAMLARLHVAALDGERRRAAELRRAALVDRRSALDGRIQELTGQLGVPGPHDPRRLSWLVHLITRWRDARREDAGARAMCASAEEQHAAAFAQLSALLAPFGYPPPMTVPDASGYVSALDGRVRDHRAALDRQAAARSRMEDCATAAALVERERAAIFAALDLDADDHDGPGERCRLFASYVECARERAIAEADCVRALDELRSDVAFDDTLLATDVLTLGEELARAEELASRHSELLVQLTQLRVQVEQGKTGREVEDALNELASADDALRAVQLRDLRAMVGDALVRYSRQVTRDEHRPAVFHRSRELLAQITRGRLQLEFTGDESGVSPAFRAIDTVTGIGHSLDELSSGSRLQLLLAVRVAFVEAQERGVKLPLLLDETLATSDDRRAAAIIDAVIALAEGGRQVCYFTAQGDEVAKWSAALAAREAPYTVIDLGACRGIGPTDVAPLLSARAADWRLTIPSSDGHTYDSYGATIRVPAIRAGRDHAGAAHLWYLVDELAPLDHLLSLGLTSWGELRMLHEQGGAAVLDEHPTAYPRAAALADALAALHEAAAIGRGREVDREAITRCEAVSAGKREEVIALAIRYGGDAADLLDGLRRGEVPGFQRKKMDDLETFLREERHLDRGPARTPAELDVAMLAGCAHALKAKTITGDDLDRLRARIDARARASAANDGDAMSGQVSPWPRSPVWPSVIFQSDHRG